MPVLFFSAGLILSGCKTAAVKTAPTNKQNTGVPKVVVLLPEAAIIPEVTSRANAINAKPTDAVVVGGFMAMSLPVGIGLGLGLGIVDYMIQSEHRDRIEGELKPLIDVYTRDRLKASLNNYLSIQLATKNHRIEFVHSKKVFKKRYKKLSVQGHIFVKPILSIGQDYRSLQFNIAIEGRNDIAYTAFSPRLNTFYVDESMAHWTANNAQVIEQFLESNISQAFYYYNILKENSSLASSIFSQLSYELDGEAVEQEGIILSDDEAVLIYQNSEGRIFAIPK